ncbi:MAG: 8-amino-7-oxononanoate synthase [Limnobacter sp.]|nr:8-amino-7-oxononanoate synthase [Limnobacter sp.]
MNLNQLAQEYLESRARRSLKRNLPQHARLSGRIDLSSNDYLGLSQNPEVIEAGIACAREYGSGATGSRLLSGNLPCFERLEEQVAQFKNAPAALVFSTGYQANSAALSEFMSPPLLTTKPLVFTDKLIHASLHHACQRAGITQNRFHHNDMQHLEQLLQAHQDNPAPKWIVTETVFGMDGDKAPIETLAHLALQYDAAVYLDEAHATGVLGPQGRGLGAIETPDITALKNQGRWIVMGTFSKAVGVAGAYVCTTPIMKEFLINRCSGFVYSTAPSPFVVGAVAKALELIPNMDIQRQALLNNARAFRETLHQAGLDTGLSETHIVPVIVKTSEAAVQLKQTLLERGFEVSAVRPPTVPKETARIRMALNSTVPQSLLNELSGHIAQWAKQ